MMAKQLDIEVYALQREVRDLRARLSIITQFLVKQFPEYFAGETALGIATNGEKLGDTELPDIAPIDLRTADEIARGESYNLRDLVAMDAG